MQNLSVFDRCYVHMVFINEKPTNLEIKRFSFSLKTIEMCREVLF